MKLWEIKAQSLRLMFADTDIEFSEEDFFDRNVYNNSNTREKLVRMEDSIRRAIDLYYTYVGETKQVATFDLSDDVEVDLSEKVDFGRPIRVDIEAYREGRFLGIDEQVNFSYDSITKKVFFIGSNYKQVMERGVNLVVRIWYYAKKLNIPFAVDEITYDLNDIYIPEEVQRMIPYFVKGELYEEDEYNVAQTARMQYMQFLTTVPKPFINVQTKVKRAKVFDKR